MYDHGRDEWVRGASDSSWNPGHASCCCIPITLPPPRTPLTVAPLFACSPVRQAALKLGTSRGGRRRCGTTTTPYHHTTTTVTTSLHLRETAASAHSSAAAPPPPPPPAPPPATQLPCTALWPCSHTPVDVLRCGVARRPAVERGGEERHRVQTHVDEAHGHFFVRALGETLTRRSPPPPTRSLCPQCLPAACSPATAPAADPRR